MVNPAFKNSSGAGRQPSGRPLRPALPESLEQFAVRIVADIRNIPASLGLVTLQGALTCPSIKGYNPDVRARENSIIEQSDIWTRPFDTRSPWQLAALTRLVLSHVENKPVNSLPKGVLDILEVEAYRLNGKKRPDPETPHGPL